MTLPVVLKRFRKLDGVPLGTRIFLQLRWRLTPYARMAARIPESGPVLDLGCGHGLLSIALATQGPHRQVLGIDHDLERIALARQAGQGIPNLQIQEGSLLEPPAGPWSGITAIDVMHYFEPALQEKILNGAFAGLAPGGVLALREVDPRGGLASRFNRFYEKIATATGFTQAEKKGLHFRSPEEWCALLARLGFTVRSEPCSSILFADILYVCEKPRGLPAR